LSVPASSTPLLATRYEQEKEGQVLTYWISDEARPLGLVKLRSRGPKASQNYELVLVSLLKNVGRKIDPNKAVALTAEGRAVLDTPLH
jgi:hypothetical protein